MTKSTKWLLTAAVVLCGLARCGDGAEAAEPVTLENLVAPEPNRADEPLAEKFSLEQGLALSRLGLARLATVVAMLHLSHEHLVPDRATDASPPTRRRTRQVRKFAEEAISLRWEEVGPRSDAEVVAIAAALALNDAATTRKLHPLTRTALDRMWTVQRPAGDWKWPMRCRWPPMESDEHYGVTLAAIGTGAAPDGYAQTPAAQAGLAKIRTFLKNNPPTICTTRRWSCGPRLTSTD